MPSPLIWPPNNIDTLKSTPERLSAAPSRSYTWRTAAPSTRAASNMLLAFQIVIGSPGSAPSPLCSIWRISRTDWEIDRLPADSSTMKRSPVCSQTIILRNELIWSKPALVRESDRKTSPALSLMATQYVMKNTGEGKSGECSADPRSGTRSKHQVVAVHHLRLCAIAEQFLELGRGLAAQDTGLGSGVVGQAAGDFCPRGIAHGNHVAARGIALYRRHADRQQALALGAQLGRSPGVDHHAAAQLQMVGHPLLARLRFLGLRHQQTAQ